MIVSKTSPHRNPTPSIMKVAAPAEVTIINLGSGKFRLDVTIDAIKWFVLCGIVA
jgi:hypothetical protein